MQINKKVAIDARDFPAVWKSLTKDEQDKLALEIYKKKCCTTKQTILNWAAGENKPYPAVRNLVAECVKKVTGNKTAGRLLFPES